MRAGCSQLPARLGVCGFGAGFWFLAAPDEVVCPCPKFAQLQRPLLMSAEDELQRRAVSLHGAPDEKWAFVIRVSDVCVGCSRQGPACCAKCKKLSSFAFQICGQLQVLSACSAAAGVRFWIARMVGKEQRCPRKDEGERGATVKASRISCGHPGDPVFGRGSTSSLKKEKGLSDALLRCGPGLGCIPVLGCRRCLLLLLQTFFSGRNISSESIHKSHFSPFSVLTESFCLISFHATSPSKLKFHRFYRLHLGAEPSGLSDGELVCHSLCCCRPRGHAPLPCNLCFIVPLRWVASRGESQTSPSPPLS